MGAADRLALLLENSAHPTNTSLAPKNLSILGKLSWLNRRSSLFK
jgi:hypothetical protein